MRRCVENQVGRHVLVFACFGADTAKLDNGQVAIGNNVVSTPVARVVARREILQHREFNRTKGARNRLDDVVALDVGVLIDLVCHLQRKN